MRLETCVLVISTVFCLNGGFLTTLGLFFRPDHKYEGQFSKGKFHGYGVFEQGNIKYEGQFEDGKIQGLGNKAVLYASITLKISNVHKVTQQC